MNKDVGRPRKTTAQLFVEYSVSHEVALAASYRGRDAAAGVVHVLLPCVEHVAIPAEAPAGLDAEQIAQRDLPVTGLHTALVDQALSPRDHRRGREQVDRHVGQSLQD